MTVYIVTIQHKDYHEEIKNVVLSNGGSVKNERPSLDCVTVYKLNEASLEALLQNNNVLEVIPAEDFNLQYEPNVNYGDIFFNKNPTGSDDTNWGLARHSQANPFGLNTEITLDIDTDNVGNGVDVVIQDTGISFKDTNGNINPEFTDTSGNSRIQEIDWYATSSNTGSLPSDFYNNPSSSHGTHVASIAAGRWHGWAKDAQIFDLHIRLGGNNKGLFIEESFELLIDWHNSKTNNRPTIVNASWGRVDAIDYTINNIGNADYTPNYRKYPDDYSDFGVKGTYDGSDFDISFNTAISKGVLINPKLTGQSTALEQFYSTTAISSSNLQTGPSYAPKLYYIDIVGTSDFTQSGAAANLRGLHFTSTGPTPGTGVCYEYTQGASFYPNSLRAQFASSIKQKVGGYSSALSALIKQATDAGIFFVKAAGNSNVYLAAKDDTDYDTTIQYKPDQYGLSATDSRIRNGVAKYINREDGVGGNAIVVGALASDNTYQDYKAYFSNFGPGIDVYAAGQNIMAVDNSSSQQFNYGFTFTRFGNTNTQFTQIAKSGTSMAAPQITGQVACYLAENPNTTPAQMKTILRAQSQSVRSTMNLSTLKTKTRNLFTDMTVEGKQASTGQFYPLPTASARQASYSTTGYTIETDIEENAMDSNAKLPTLTLFSSIDFAEDEDTSTNIETPLVDDDVTDTTGFRIGMRNIALNKVNILWQSGR